MDTPILNPNSVSTEGVLFAIQFPEICQHKCDFMSGCYLQPGPRVWKKLSLVVKVIQLALITDWSPWQSKSTTWTLSPIWPISRFLFFLICSFSFFPVIHMLGCMNPWAVCAKKNINIDTMSGCLMSSWNYWIKAFMLISDGWKNLEWWWRLLLLNSFPG